MYRRQRALPKLGCFSRSGGIGRRSGFKIRRLYGHPGSTPGFGTIKLPNMKGRKPQAAWVPDRPDPRGAPPALLGDLLVDAAAYVAQKSGSAIPREEWRSLVGSKIANRTRVGRLYRGVLTLYVATSAWSNELSFLKQSLIAKLKMTGREVSDLRFVLDQLEPPKRVNPKQINEALPVERLPDDLMARLQLVDDPNLRAAIAQAARHSLGKNK